MLDHFQYALFCSDYLTPMKLNIFSSCVNCMLMLTCNFRRWNPKGVDSEGVREQSVELKGEAEDTARSQNKTLEKRDRRQQGHEGWRGGATRWRCAVKQSPSVHDRRLGVWTNKLSSKGVKGSLDNPVIVFDGMACPKLNERMKRLLLWAVVILHSEGYSSPIGCSQIMLLYYVSCRSLALHMHLDSNIGRLDHD